MAVCLLLAGHRVAVTDALVAEEPSLDQPLVPCVVAYATIVALPFAVVEDGTWRVLDHSAAEDTPPPVDNEVVPAVVLAAEDN